MQDETRAYVLNMLRLDHKRLIDYFFQFDQSNDLNHKKSFAMTALNELAIHSHLEEEIFYPYVRVKKPLIAELIDRCVSQHDTCDRLIAQLDFDNMDETFERHFFQIVDAIKSHMQFEEREIFVQLDDVDLGAIAHILDMRRNELLKAEAGDNKNSFTPQTAFFKHSEHTDQSGAQH
jgi:hypothetical protein